MPLEKLLDQRNIDSWDYSDKLGIELMELAELYGMVKGPAQ